MLSNCRNDKGKPIQGKRILKKQSFGTGQWKDGEQIVDWAHNRTEYADENGFDIRNRESNGDYLIEIELPCDTVIIRYGPESGSFTAPVGTSYDSLSLPYLQSSVEFHKYRVSQSIRVVCRVKKGLVAPMFDSPGGAIQYFHPNTSIKELKKNGVLDEVLLWA